MASSASNFTSNTTPVPTCDAWANIKAGTSQVVSQLMDSSGVSSVAWLSNGLHGITFSNPQRFGGGGYVTVYTPEVSSFNAPCLLSSMRDMAGAGGATAAGKTAGVQIATWGFPGPVGAGGNTATQQDFPSGNLYINFASFALARESDLRSPAVLNVLKWSESFSNSPWTPSNIPAVVLSTDGTKAPDGSTASVMNEGTGSGQKVIQQYTGNYPVSIVNKPFTGSVYVKAGTRFRGRIIVYDSSTTFFGVTFNLQTKALSSSTSAVNAILSSSSITDVGGGWFRIVVSGYFTGVAINNNQTGVYINTARDTDGSVSYDGESKYFYLWGAQLEEGSVATPYIKTESTAPVLGNQDARKSLVPGASGFGVTGATYTSALTNLLSKRTATAYGTIVIPPNKSNSGSSTVSAYIENGFNVKGVSAGANSEFDISFVNTMTNSNYCVILCGEYEPTAAATVATDYTALLEYSMLMVDRRKKDTGGFRAVSLKQNSPDNSWNRSSSIFQLGFTERIHFMVFGGATYGQP